jgi:hypothetical protein
MTDTSTGEGWGTKRTILAVILAGIGVVILWQSFFRSAFHAGERFCLVNPNYSKDNPFIGTSLEIDDLANGVVEYRIKLVVPDDMDTAARFMGMSNLVDGQKSTASIEKLSQTIKAQGLTKTDCGKLATEERKQYEIISARRQKAKEVEAKKDKELDDFVKKLQPGTVICSFSDQPNNQGHYEYRIYKYQSTEEGHLNFAVGMYDLEKNDIELVTKSNEPIYVGEPELDTNFPRDLTFFGRDACLAEANKRFKPLATKIADAGLKVGDIACRSPANGSFYRIANIAKDFASGYVRGNHYGWAPQQFAAVERVTLNKQTRQIASDESGSYQYIYPATMNQFHYGEDNCLKDLEEYERQKEISSKF